MSPDVLFINELKHQRKKTRQFMFVKNVISFIQSKTGLLNVKNGVKNIKAAT